MGGVQSMYQYRIKETYEAWTKTKIIVADAEVQTDPRLGIAEIAAFTEEFEASASTETFDKNCDLCSDNEVEAVAYCKQCKQWLCLKCGKVHENITVTKFHTLTARADKECIDIRKPLVARMCTPYEIKRIYEHVLQAAYCQKTGNMCIVYEQKMQKNYVNCTYTKFDICSNDTSSLCTHTFPYRSVHMNNLIFDSSQEGVILFCTPDSYNQLSSIYKLNYTSPNPKLLIFMETRGKCADIKEFDDGFAISTQLITGFSRPDWQIQFLERNGDIKRQICYDKDKKTLFMDASFMATNMAKTVLYVADQQDQSITAINTSGDVVFKVRHGLPSASHLAVDNDDNVYIVSRVSVVRVDSGGQGTTIILEGSDDLKISSMYFNLQKERLVIFQGSKMKSFSFLP